MIFHTFKNVIFVEIICQHQKSYHFQISEKSESNRTIIRCSKFNAFKIRIFFFVRFRISFENTYKVLIDSIRCCPNTVHITYLLHTMISNSTKHYTIYFCFLSHSDDRTTTLNCRFETTENSNFRSKYHKIEMYIRVQTIEIGCINSNININTFTTMYLQFCT